MTDAWQTVDLDNGSVTWEGAVSVERGDGWRQPWRIPEAQRDLFPPVELLQRAAGPAGVRLTFRSDTSAVRLAVEPITEAGKIDCLCDGTSVHICSFAAGTESIEFAALPAGEKLIEIYLPVVVPFRLRSLHIAAGATVSPAADTRPRWITYGSSITHCGGAASPCETWPALVARSQNLHLTCLGYGGNCHAEPMLARMIRDLPADFISLKLGINIQGGASLSPRTFQAAVIGFVQIVREGHPDIPIALCSPIISPPRETVDNVVGLSLTKMRGEIETAFTKLRAHGDMNLYHVSGLDIMGEAEVGHLPDELHPDAEGYRVMARNFARAVFSQVTL